MPLPTISIDLDYLNAKDWWSRVEVRGPDECWPWKQSCGSHGYGQTWDGTHVTVAHRVAWVLHHQRQVPAGLTIDHRADCLRICCNPTHMRPCSNMENATDNGQGRKTHCPHGHPYKGENLIMRRHPKTGKPWRECRTCRRLRNAPARQP